MKPFVAVIAGGAALFGLALGAFADQATPAGGSPVVSIRSTSGTVTINGGEPGVRVGSFRPGITFNRFTVSQGQRQIRIPSPVGRNWRGMRLPARQWPLPARLEGTPGFDIGNPGGDMNVYVPDHVGVLFVNAGNGNVVLSNVRGPYVIQTAGGFIELRNVSGRGFVRTVSGDIDVSGVGGFVHAETATGNVFAQPGVADHAEIVTGRGDITYVFGRMGAGTYRFTSNRGTIHLLLQPQAGAFVDAQSDNGSVVNQFDPAAAQTRFAGPRALSLIIGGGGPEITGYSKFGSVIVSPITR